MHPEVLPSHGLLSCLFALPRYFHHPLFIILSRPLCCTCVPLNCFLHLEQFVRLWAIIFLPREICVSILCEEIWLHSSLLESMALHSKVCKQEYRSERLSKSPEQIYGSVTWVRAGWLISHGRGVIFHNSPITCYQIRVYLVFKGWLNFHSFILCKKGRVVLFIYWPKLNTTFINK